MGYLNTLPHFVETPLNTMVNPGAELRLHCSAMGSPTPAIFWLKDGQLLEEFRSLDGSSILQLQAVNKSIAGQYVCAARNQIGENRAFAEVSLGAGDWDANPSSIAKLLRDRSKLRPVTVLQCFNGTQLERHRVAWTVDGRKVGQLEESLHALNNGSMALFYFASQEELSAFGCKIRDQPGRVHLGGQVEVLDVVPRALIRPTRIYSHPKWTLLLINNVNLEPDFDKLEVMPNNSLVIRTVIDSDRGSYKCRSWNSQGKSWDDVDLIIEGMN
uniref:Ig-like domain-containing protein n=1 Tax=Ditylenchus dipsaci TaxID=166011 RepID=A0A915D542_9BILA